MLRELIGLGKPKTMPLLVSVCLLLACTDDPSAPVQGSDLRTSAARNSGDVTVSAVKPDSATQDTTLDIIVSGNGFIEGSTVTLALAGVPDPAQIRTNQTRYVSSRQLVANITVSASATTGKWDVAVRAGSKGGIGTEMFAVKALGNVETQPRVHVVWSEQVNIAAPGEPAVFAQSAVRGDGRDVFGNASESSAYQGAICGVAAKIFWNDETQAGSGDIVFSPAMDYNRQHSCGSRRFLSMFLSYQPGGAAGPATEKSPFSNVLRAVFLAEGESKSQPLFFSGIGMKDCVRLDFNAVKWPGSSNVRVTRLQDAAGVRKWKVESEYPHRAQCISSIGWTDYPEAMKYLPFSFVATEVPYPYPMYPR